MPKICIPKSRAEKLKSAFRSGEISIEGLFTMTSAQRVSKINEYIGSKELAQEVTSKLEKAYLSPNQKLAMRNWIFKHIAQAKPLYKGLTLDQSEEMAKNLNIRELGKMETEERISAISKYTGDDLAEDLNKRFEALKKSGNLQNWEERTLGTEKLRKDKKLKGSLSKLEALDDLGVLSPKDMESFMKSFVESELGVSLDFDESQKLSKLVSDQRDAYDKIIEKDDWTAANEKDIIDYFEKRKVLEEYTEELMPKTKSSVINNIVNFFRASILASPRILRNSFLYQVVPGIERTITKRLISGNFNTEDLKSSVPEKMMYKMSGVKPDKKTLKFIKDQTAMAAKIYHKTGYDISRMDTLEAGYKFFGEEVTKITGKGIFSKIGRTVNLAPKWFAGGSDMLFANIGRADTATMMSREMAKLESKKGKLPKGTTEKERAFELLKDSYSFDPETRQGRIIRASGIMDAHMMNNTQPGWWSDQVLKFRRALKIGDVNYGKAIIPFAKIANVVVAEGAKTASGFGIAQGLWKIGKGAKTTDIEERILLMRAGVGDLIRYTGLMGATVLLASFLDDDDFVGAWDTLNYKKYGLARARGAGTNYVRIFGKWIPLRYLPMINIPIAAIMTARQAKNRGDNPATGYMVGMLGQIMDAPGVREAGNIYDNLSSAMKADNLEGFSESLGLDGEGLMNWAKVRMIPSVLSYDLYNALFPKDSKYDFMGREIQQGGLFRDDTSNRITMEFSQLDESGNMPTISDPNGSDAKELEEKLGEERYQRLLSEYKKDYAKKVATTITKVWYNKLSDEDKKKEINAIRKKEITDELKFKNEITK